MQPNAKKSIWAHHPKGKGKQCPAVPDSVEKGETKINNCIANCKKSFFEKEKDEYEKAKKFSIISEMKANLVNKQ